jgi:hypothetical protein
MISPSLNDLISPESSISFTSAGSNRDCKMDNSVITYKHRFGVTGTPGKINVLNPLLCGLIICQHSLFEVAQNYRLLNH